MLGVVNFFEIYGDPLTDAFLTVGVLVAIMLAVIGYARARWGQRWDTWLIRYPKAGPLAAAALSLPPGCSGVLATVALYGEGRVTYGTVISALLSTMGDAAWLLLAEDPVLAIELKVVFFIVGAVIGYGVDLARIDPRREDLNTHAISGERADHTVTSLHFAAGASGSVGTVERPVDTAVTAVRWSPPPAGPPAPTWNQIEPCCIHPSLSHPGDAESRTSRTVRVLAAALFWSIIAVGLLLQLPVEFNFADEEAFPALFGTNLYMVVGVVGFVMSTAVAFVGRQHSQRCHCVQGDWRTVVLQHVAYRAANMIVLVGIVSLIFVALSETFGLEPGDLPFYGAFGVLTAALLGLVPSCGLEVVMAGIFLAGGMPLPALIAYLLSHDGAGLIPLFAVHRRSAILSAALTTIPALAIGITALLIL